MSNGESKLKEEICKETMVQIRSIVTLWEMGGYFSAKEAYMKVIEELHKASKQN